MVSNVLEMGQQALIELLKTFKKKYEGDAEFAKLRAGLPARWPM